MPSSFSRFNRRKIGAFGTAASALFAGCGSAAGGTQEPVYIPEGQPNILCLMCEDIGPYLGLTEAELRERLWPRGRQPEVSAPEFAAADDGTLEITCPTLGASIAWQVNGRGFDEKHWMLYTVPITVRTGDTVTAIATRIGYKPTEPAIYIVD